MTEAHIKIRHEGGNTYEGPISGVLETHLAGGWSFDSLRAAEPITVSREQAEAAAWAIYCEVRA